jgi:hypothetical protein
LSIVFGCAHIISPFVSSRPSLEGLLPDLSGRSHSVVSLSIRRFDRDSSGAFRLSTPAERLVTHFILVREGIATPLDLAACSRRDAGKETAAR